MGHQQVPKTDPRSNGGFCPKDGVMLEESNESKVLIVGGDAAKLMAIGQLLPQYN